MTISEQDLVDAVERHAEVARDRAEMAERYLCEAGKCEDTGVGTQRRHQLERLVELNAQVSLAHSAIGQVLATTVGNLVRGR